MRPYKAPFYFNITFYDPKRDPKTPEKNAGNVKYIGTRSGVDKGVELTHEEAVLRAVLPDTAAHHIQYAHERPRSHGLFSSGEDEIIMHEVQKELLNHKGMAWRVIVSLTGEDAERLDMLNRGSWMETIKYGMPRLAESMGIAESNLNWVAAYHAEKDHPHAHIIFWEKKPKRRRGMLTDHVRKQGRKAFVQKVYAADRDRFGQEKTAMRDRMRELGVTTLREQVDFVRTWKDQQRQVNQLHALTGNSFDIQLPAQLDIEQTRYLTNRLQVISEMLPGKGRLMLKFMPEPVKQEVKKLSEWMYNQSQFSDMKAKYEASSEILARPYSQQPEHLSAAVEKAKVDMIERLGQVVLKAAYETGKENRFAIHPDKAKIAVEKLGVITTPVMNTLPETLAREILKQSHRAGMPQEDYIRIAEKLQLPAIPNTEVARIYAAPIESPQISKGVTYLLKAGLGESEAAALMGKIGFSDEVIKKMDVYKKTTTEPNALARVFKVPDLQEVTVEQMAKLLISCGMPKDEACKTIEAWNDRSSSGISTERIEKLVNRSDKIVNDTKDWGRTPIMTKKEFGQLCKRLGLEIPYPWRSTRERENLARGHDAAIGQGVIKSVMQAFSAAMRSADAERERAQMQAVNRIKRNTEREEEERDRRERSR